MKKKGTAEERKKNKMIQNKIISEHKLIDNNGKREGKRECVGDMDERSVWNYTDNNNDYDVNNHIMNWYKFEVYELC